MMTMYDVSNFGGRVSLTDSIERQLQNYLTEDQAVVQKFGSEVLTQNCKELSDFLCTNQANIDASAMIVKFAPDFIILKKNSPQKVYFLDVKHSITPIYSEKKLDQVRKTSGVTDLTRSRIGEIAREALLSYRRYYPNTIVLMASPYNPKLLMAQFADKIKCLYCYRGEGKDDYDCNKDCPWKKGSFFDIEIMNNSIGSQKPITNVDFDSFMSAEVFFEEIDIHVSKSVSEDIKTMIRNEGIHIQDSLPDGKKNKVKFDLFQSGCHWIQCPVYSSDGNDFYHCDSACPCLRNTELISYSSVYDAIKSGKKVCCKFCSK